MDTDRIKGMAQNAGGAIQKTVGDLTDDPQGQVEGVARQVAGKTQELYGQAKESLSGASSVVADYAGTAYEQGGDYTSRGARMARQEIVERPLTAIILAGVIGYLLSMFLHSRD